MVALESMVSELQDSLNKKKEELGERELSTTSHDWGEINNRTAEIIGFMQATKRILVVKQEPNIIEKNFREKADEILSLINMIGV